MNDHPPRQELQNAAWVTIPTRLDAQTVLRLCFNVEWIYRLNPYLKIYSWQSKGGNLQEIEWENHSVEPVNKEIVRFTVETKENELQLIYQTGIKSKSLFIIEPMNEGAHLTLVDDYGDRGEHDRNKVDRSLHIWGQALQTFFNRYRIFRYIPFADYLIDRIWIKLSPLARRITYILLLITFVELVALLLFVVIMLLV